MTLFRTRSTSRLRNREKARPLQKLEKFTLPGDAATQLPTVETSSTPIYRLRLVFALLDVERRSVNSRLKDAYSSSDQSRRIVCRIDSNHRPAERRRTEIKTQDILL
jgi:hypothetical protein